MTVRTRPDIDDFAGGEVNGAWVSGICVAHDPQSTSFRVRQWNGSIEIITATRDDYAVVTREQLEAIRTALFDAALDHLKPGQEKLEIMKKLARPEVFLALPSSEPLVALAEKVSRGVLGEDDFGRKWHITYPALFA